MHRFTTFNLRLLCELLHDFLSLSTQLSSVREMAISVCSGSFILSRGGVRIFKSAPKLYNFTMNRSPDSDLTSFPLNLYLPWAQLTKLGFSSDSILPSCAYQLLSECSNLSS